MRIVLFGLLSLLFLTILFGEEQTTVESQGETEGYERVIEQESSESAALKAERPKICYRFTQARLSDALAVIAEDAGIRLIPLPKGHSSNKLVTFLATASPFEVLELLAKEYQLELRFNGEKNLWYLDPVKGELPKKEREQGTSPQRQKVRVWLLNGKEITPDRWDRSEAK